MTATIGEEPEERQLPQLPKCQEKLPRIARPLPAASRIRGTSHGSTASSHSHSYHLLDCGDKLYGREKEVSLLQTAYRKCLEDSSQSSGRVLLITGKSGNGKTALARHSLERQVRDDGGWLLYGKCEQIHGQTHTSTDATASTSSYHEATATGFNVPYAPFAEAFGSLFEIDNDTTSTYAKSMSQSDVLTRLSSAILEATKDTNVQTLTEAFPVLKKALAKDVYSSHSSPSPQTTSFVPALSSQEPRKTTTNNLAASAILNEADLPTNLVVTKFLQAFCSRETPVVLLLDDLQWLDSSSLSLFKTLAMKQNNIPGLLLLATCRGNEVSFHAPLSQALRSLEEQHRVSVQEIQVQDLPFCALKDLVEGLLHLPETQTSQVADLIFKQTQGNPFFALQFLRNLTDSNILRYDDLQHQWKWELPEDESFIQSFAKLDVLSLCSLIISNLVQHDQQHEHHQEGKHNDDDDDTAIGRVLMVASCLGTEFSLSQIEASVAPLKYREILLQALNALQKKGIFMSNQQKNKSPNNKNSILQSRTISYRWAHDRFQQAAYSSIPSETRGAFHVSVGLNLLRRLSPLQAQNDPFVVVHQFMHTLDFAFVTSSFQSSTERIQMVALCLAAGERAAMSSAFESAATYLKLGLKILGPPDAAFATNYPVTLNLFNAAAEMEFCRGNYNNVDRLVATIVENTKSLEDRLRAHETQIYSLGARQDLASAVRLGMQVLKELGESFPRKPGMLSLLPEVIKTKRRVASITVDDVMKLKPVRDWKKAAALRIINMMIPHTSRCNINFTVLLATRCIQITLQHGVSEMACVGFFSFGTMLCTELGYVDDGIRVVEIAQKIQEMFDAKAMICRVRMCLWAFTKSRKFPIRQSIVPLQDAARSGYLSGDIEMASLCLYCANSASFVAGLPLPAMEQETATLNEQFAGRNVENILLYLRIHQQVIQNLRGGAKDPLVLTGDFLTESSAFQQSKDAGDICGVTLLHLYQCYLAVFLNDSKLARQASKKFKKSSLQAFNVPLLYQSHFMEGLSDVIGTRGKGKKIGRAGKAALKKLRKCARHAPENVLNKIYLIEAERFAARGKKEKAIGKFQESMDQAKEQNFIHEEALAAERAGIWLREWEDVKLGNPMLEKARGLYEMWGSPVKVRQVSALISRVEQKP